MDNNEVCSYFEQYQNGHEFKIGRHNREVLYLQQKQLWDDLCTVESNLVLGRPTDRKSVLVGLY